MLASRSFLSSRRPVRGAEPICARLSGKSVRSRRAPRPLRAGSYTLKPLVNEMELEAEGAWLSMTLATWLDEEWTVLPEHQQLGKAAADAYVALRRNGEHDVGSVVLAVASELQKPELAAAFHTSFTSPYEVSNKLSETVMLRDGCDVCCISPADRERIARINEILCGSK